MKSKNRVSKTASYIGIHRLLCDLIDGTTSLSEKEIQATICRLLQRPDDKFNSLLWLIALHADAHPLLIAKAGALLNSRAELSDAEIYAFALPQALTYILNKDTNTRTIKEELLQSGSPLLRRAFAEYLIQHGALHDGLWLMLDIMSCIGNDHATADNIALTFNSLGTPALQQELLLEAEQCDNNGRHDRAENARWLASCIPDKH